MHTPNTKLSAKKKDSAKGIIELAGFANLNIASAKKLSSQVLLQMSDQRMVEINNKFSDQIEPNQTPLKSKEDKKQSSFKQREDEIIEDESCSEQSQKESESAKKEQNLNSSPLSLTDASASESQHSRLSMI